MLWAISASFAASLWGPRPVPFHSPLLPLPAQMEAPAAGLQAPCPPPAFQTQPQDIRGSHPHPLPAHSLLVTPSAPEGSVLALGAPPCCPPTPSLAGFPPSSSPGATPPSTAQEAGRVSSVLCGRSSRIPTQQVRLWGGSHQPGQQDSLRPGRPAHVCIVNISTEN